MCGALYLCDTVSISSSHVRRCYPSLVVAEQREALLLRVLNSLAVSSPHTSCIPHLRPAPAGTASTPVDTSLWEGTFKCTALRWPHPSLDQCPKLVEDRLLPKHYRARQLEVALVQAAVLVAVQFSVQRFDASHEGRPDKAGELVTVLGRLGDGARLAAD